MPWSLQTVGSTIFYIPSGSNLPLAGAGTIGTNGNGTIIMVGRGTKSIAVYNITGGTWSIPSTLFSTTGRSVAVGNSKYVAVGEGTNTFAITNNGTTWGTIASPPFSTAGYDIVYDGSRWVAVGTGTNSVAYFDIQTSTWVSVSNGITSGYGLFYDATVPRIWATGLGSNTIAYASAANSTWTGATITGMTQVNAVGIATTFGTMVTVGYGTGGVASYSTNYTASPPTFNNSSTTFAVIGSNGGDAVAYGNGLFIHGGSPTASGNTFASSNDGGATWSGIINTRSLSSYTTKIVYGNGKFFACGNRGTSTLLTSTNGTSWASATSGGSGFDPFTTAGGRGAFYNDASNIWMVCGGGGTQLYMSTNNGDNWSSVAGNLFTNQTRAVAYGNGVWIATGFDSAGATNVIARSFDGSTNWTKVTSTDVSSGSYYGNDVKYNNGVWLAGATNATGLWILKKSTNNGETWSNIMFANTSAMTSVIRIYSDGNRWYISGTGATGYQFAYSTKNDPSTNDISFVSNVTKGGGDIAVSPTSKTYVAGGIGTNNLQKSSNGTSWTTVTSPFSVAVNDVKNNGTTWVAVGEGGNTIATSSDGTTWTGRGTTTFSIRGNKVRWNSTQNKWYAVGEGGNTLVASTDGTGTSWTSINTTGYVDISGIGLAFN